MSVEEKFHAAVNVIRSLPKSGSYQPSNELMLRFYSYFKQATEGTCDKSKPAFWDIINRTKWEAWNRLGNMTKEEAMEAYVSELHRIVETMSYSDSVASFVAATGDGDHLASFPTSDLELVAGDVLERVRSEHNTPIGSRETSRAPSPLPRVESPTVLRSSASSPATGYARTTSNAHESDEEFIDTVDSEPEVAQQQRESVRVGNGHAHQLDEYTQLEQNRRLHQYKILEEIPAALLRLEQDVAALRKAAESDRLFLQSGRRAHSTWWPWAIHPGLVAFLLAWPFVAIRINRALSRGK